MRFNKLILFILSIGVILSTAIIYFYISQRNFTKYHREFLISVNTLETINTNLKNQILQSSIYSYHNQDKISQTIKKLENKYLILTNSYLVNNHKGYATLKDDLKNLKKHIDLNLNNIENYTMLNSGIKNSLIFLSRYVENTIYLQQNKELFIKATKILNNFNNTKRMQDIDYIDKHNFLLYSNTTDSKMQKAISYFNLHSKYLTKNYPIFIKTTKSILNNDINIYIEKLKQKFSKIALSDFKALDIFALLLFSAFVLSIFFIVMLFIKYLKENQKLTKATASLKYSLEYDHLTDLHNRTAFEMQIQNIKKPHLLLINIDGFKYINDIYGNDIGNILLKKLADLLKAELNNIKTNNIYRLGGDEFGILFDDIDKDKALQIAQNLETTISKHKFIVQDLTLHLFVSIASNSIAPILENTDLALKLLKQDTTKRILEYRKELNLQSNVKENMKIVSQIKSAIEDDRIVPFFQPIINLKTSKIEKYEALVRLKLDEETYLSPFVFLDISKKSSYYHTITKIMIEKTIQTAKEFPQYRFSINISMSDILNTKLIETLFKIFSQNPQEASRIDIELLESENLQDIESVQKFLKRLQSFGSKIIIDDFGTAYENFSYFSDLDIDIIKIDGSIIKEIEKDKRKLHMLKSIHKFSNGMDMKNVAEFVESKEIAMTLDKIGIDYAQGYYFSEPLKRPLDDDKVVI
jgi:diguanylate cyclase (GGDEF)-like protein